MTSEKKSYPIYIGPIHPALKEPAMFEFEISGEEISDVDINMGHNHRGIEWMARSRNPVQIIYLAERVCGICNICHALAFARAVESIAEINVPERAQYIRVIASELERIHSHLLWAGVAAHEIGFDSVLYLTWRARENVLDLIEYLTGNRVTKAIITVGGVRRDITPEQLPKIEKTLVYCRGIFDKLKKIFLDDPVVAARTRDVGVLTKEEALRLCAVGPTARASGVPKDVRQDQAYEAYGDIDFKAITPDMLTGEIKGDVYDRIIVRLLEVKQSIDIIEQCVKMMPSGDIMAEKKIPVLLAKLKKISGEGIGRHEAPRGEVFHYVKMSSKESIESWKIRAPSYSNIASWKPTLIGEQIADIPIIVASIDPCISCTERITATKSTGEILTAERLHQLSIEKTRRLQNGLR